MEKVSVWVKVLPHLPQQVSFFSSVLPEGTQHTSSVSFYDTFLIIKFHFKIKI